jgi:hypothetical protein
MDDKRLSCRGARQIDLVEYLAQLGHLPQKIKGSDHWYFSPLREEKTPSFKVNRVSNMWFDHGTGLGGDLIDFGTLYHHCTISELLDRLSQHSARPLRPCQSASNQDGAGEKKEFAEGRIKVLDTRYITAQPLIEYLQKRNIPLHIAGRYCREVVFSLYDRQQTAIGFPNRSGGFELRNAYFKGSSSPKDITFFDNHTSEIAVFEGFFNYLSFQTLNRNNQAPLTNCLVLNSLAFLERSRGLMEQYSQIHLILDRDAAGTSFTAKALQWDPDRYIDQSDFYQGFKDLNEWLIHQPPPQLRLSRRPSKGKSL